MPFPALKEANTLASMLVNMLIDMLPVYAQDIQHAPMMQTHGEIHKIRNTSPAYCSVCGEVQHIVDY